MYLSLGMAVLTFVLPALAEPSHYLLLPSTPPALSREIGPGQLLGYDDGISLVKVPRSRLAHWSQVVHDRLKGCGGYIDVTDEVEKGTTPAQMIRNEKANKNRITPRRVFPLRGTTEIAGLVARADDDRLWSFLTELTQFPDRSATTANGKKAAEFLKTKAEAAAGHLPGFSAEFVGSGSFYQQPSVVITLPGTDPSLPGVLIGGHMDTFSNNKPGADDDGSGTAVVMEALKAIGLPGARFRRTLYFAWYSAEERGLVGSKYVVDHFKKQGRKVSAALQMDMVGFRNPKDAADVHLLTDFTNDDLTESLKKMIGQYTPTTSVGETECGYACSDHANWHRIGVPVVAPVESSFDNMNSKLHTGDDKMTYLDKKHLGTFARITLAFLGEIGGNSNKADAQFLTKRRGFVLIEPQ